MAPATVWHITGKGFFILLALAVITTIANSQDLILNGNQTNNGLIRVRRDVVNNTTASVTVSGTGIVRLDRNVTPHAIRSASGSYPIAFSNLDMIQNEPTTCQVDVTVTNNLRIGNGSTTYDAGGNGFDIGTHTLTINNLSSYMSGSTAALTFNGGTVVFNGTVAQSILNNVAGVAYGTLTISGAGAKSVTTGGVITAATLTQAGGQLSVDDSIDVTGSGSFADIGAIAAGARLRLASGATSGSVTAMNNSGTGIFENAANIAVAITTLTSNAGTIRNSGTGSIAFTNAAANNGTITNTSTGTVDFNNDLTGTGTVSQTANGTLQVAGLFTQNTYSLNNGTVLYDGTAAGQSVIATAYNNLTLNNSTKTLAGAVTVNGNIVMDASSALNMNDNNMSVGGTLDLGNNITTGTGVLTMTSTTAANLSGTGEIRGAVRRNHDFTSGQNYMFNRPDVYIGTSAHAASDITLRMTAATDPAAPLASANYVQRNYTIATNSAGSLESIRLHYEVSELQGSLAVDDSKIGLRFFSAGAWSKVSNTGQTRTSGGGNTYMTYSGLSNALPANGELGMFKVNFVTAANGANISLASGWDENALPGNTDDAVINHTGVVTGNTAVDVATLTVNPGMSLSTDGSGLLTVATSTQVDGTLNITNADASTAAATIGNAGAISVSNGRTLSGTSLVNNSSNSSTFAGNLNLSSLANNGTGALNFNGNGSTITDSVSNAAGAAINIGGTLNILTASAFTLSSDGNITVNGATGVLNIGASGVASSLTMAGTSTLTINNTAGLVNVFGNLEIGANANINNSGTITIGE